MKNILTILFLVFTAYSCDQFDQPGNVKTDDDKDQPTAIDNSRKEMNPALIGLWKNTEILGTGAITMTNETLIEFFEDGSFLTWPGRSVGPDYSRDEDKSQAGKGTWFCKGKSLHLIDSATGQDGITYYSVSESGLLLSNGGSEKQIYERIR